MPAPVILGSGSGFEVTRLEGLYVELVTPPSAVMGAQVNTTFICGETVRGPKDRAVEIGSVQRFLDVYGGRNRPGDATAITNKVWKALLNKKFGKLVIVRACAAAAAAGTKNFANGGATDIVKVDATSPGKWADDVTVQVANATDGNADHFDLIVKYDGRTKQYRNLNVNGATDNNLEKVIGTDDANWIKVTKLANGRPVNAAATALTGGSDGSIADSDYTAAGRGLNVLAGYPGAGQCFIAEKSNDNLKVKVNTLAAADRTKIWIIEADAETTSIADGKTDVADYRQKNVIYAFNHAYTQDPETATEILTSPSSWLACVLSQRDVNIHPGDPDNKELLSGITRLYNEGYSREDYISLKEGGICALEKLDGYSFVSGVVTYLPDGTGAEQITHCRMVNWLILAPLAALSKQVKKPNTISRKAAIKGVLDDFLGRSQAAEFVVDQDRDDMGKGFIVDMNKLNTGPAEQGGLLKTLMRVRLQGHILYLDLVVEAGTQVTIREAA